MTTEDFIQPKFKIQSIPKTDKKWVCVWYIDSRDCQDILDRKYWSENRQSIFYDVRDKTFCKVWVRFNWERTRKSDSWAMSDNDNVDSDTTSKWDSSDAFKRACVMRWIGRYLYTLPKLWISYEEYTSNKFKINEFIKTKYKKELDNREKQIPCETKKKAEFTPAILDKFKKDFRKYKDKYTTPDDFLFMLDTNYILTYKMIREVVRFYNEFK